MRQLIQHRLKSKILSGGTPTHEQRGNYVKRITTAQSTAVAAAVTFGGVPVTFGGVPVTFTP